jgi:hypothetical protein
MMSSAGGGDGGGGGVRGGTEESGDWVSSRGEETGVVGEVVAVTAGVSGVVVVGMGLGLVVPGAAIPGMGIAGRDLLMVMGSAGALTGLMLGGKPEGSPS